MMSNLVRILPELDTYLSTLNTTVKVLLPPPRSGEHRAEKRLIVIDGANIMRATTKGRKRDKDINLIALLSLVRLLIKYDFEVAVYIPDKYWRPGVIRGGLEAFEKLSKFEITFMIPQCDSDHQYLFRIAKDYGGVVLTNETYRGNNTQDGFEMEAMLKHYYSHLTFTDAHEFKHSMTADDQYVASHFFDFKEGNFYANINDAYYSRCKQKNIYRFKNWETTKGRMLKALDECLIKLITEEFDRANALSIRGGQEQAGQDVSDDESSKAKLSPPGESKTGGEHKIDEDKKLDGQCSAQEECGKAQPEKITKEQE